MDYQVPAGGIPVPKTKKYEPRCKINKPFRSIINRVNTKRLAVLLTILAMAFLANVPTAMAQAGDSNSEASTDNPHVLLISTVVDDADLIAEAAKAGVRVIAYDAEQASLDDLLASIRASLQGEKAASVGMVAHDYGEAKFYLTGGHTISLNSTLSSPEQRSFWHDLGKMIHKDGRVDLFACNLAQTEPGQMLISELSEVSGITVAASTNATGNRFAGGDWILETADIDARGIYFNPVKLRAFQGLLVSQVQKLTADDAATGDAFGWAVDISGDVAIVGATVDDGDTGSAYIFRRNGSGTWVKEQKIIHSNRAGDDRFGYAVAIEGDTAVVTALQDDASAGSAFIFQRDTNTGDWDEVKKLTSNSGVETFFGWSVDLDGDNVIVGSIGALNGLFFESGAAYVFSRNQGGNNNWGQVAKLTDDSVFSFDSIGSGVAISGDTAIVGASGFNIFTGQAYVFERNGSGVWQFLKILSRPGGGVSSNSFGDSVDIDGDTIIIGELGFNGGEGDAFIFERNAGGPNNWGDVKRLISSFSGGAETGVFGWSVAISGDIAVVGEWSINSLQGSASVFARNEGGANNWGNVGDISESPSGNPGDNFGLDVAVNNDTAIIGAPVDDATAGSAFIFQLFPPSLSNPTVTNIGTDIAILGATVDNEGDSPIKERGVVWSTSPNPDLTNNDGRVTTTGTTGQFAIIASSLTPGTTFYFRGYAINDVGTGFTDDKIFRTLAIFTVTVNSAVGGSTDQDGTQSVVELSDLTITATPDTGYSFSNWTGTLFSLNNPLRLSGIISDLSLTPVFTRDEGTLIVNIDDGGSGGSFTISGPNDFNNGVPLAGQTTTFDSLVPTGTYTVTFSDETGFTVTVEANPFNVNGNEASGDLAKMQTETITGTYTRDTGTLNVNLTQNSSSGSFTISGPSDFNGGVPLSGQTANYSDTVPTGTYTVEFSDETGFTTSVTATSFAVTGNEATGDLAKNGTETVNGSYLREAGTLNIDIELDGSSGSFTVSGPGDFNGGSDLTGQTVDFNGNVPTGDYTVTFTEETGYTLVVSSAKFSVTGAEASGTINDGETHAVSGIYTRDTGTLTVNVSSDSDAGSYTISGPSDFNGGSDLSDQTSNLSSSVPTGSYTVTYDSLADHDLAVSASSFAVSSNQASGSIAKGGAETVSGVYTRHTGSLQVTIDGPSAGGWRLFGQSDWRPGGNIADGIPTGPSVGVEFRPLAGYETPLPIYVEIIKDQTTQASATYVIKEGATGSVSVDGTDNSGAPEGSQWRPVGGTGGSSPAVSGEWFDFGEVVSDIPAGDLSIEFRLVSGYITPAERIIFVRPGITNKFAIDYLRPFVAHKNDYNGDGADDLAVYTSKTRTWSIARVPAASTSPSARVIFERKFGPKGVVPAPGDYDGDGVTDLSYYDSSKGIWRVLRQFIIRDFGEENDIPVPGDYDGDGSTDPALFSPESRKWTIRLSSTGETRTLFFGNTGDIPVPGDYDGDGRSDPAVYDVVWSRWRVAIYNERKERWIPQIKLSVRFGLTGDIPVPADYDGDGTSDFAIYRPTTGLWNVRGQFETEFGQEGDVPVPSDWAGLGRAIPAIYRSKNGTWRAIDDLLNARHGRGGSALISGR